MIYMVCLQHKRNMSYFEILHVFLDRESAEKAKDVFNSNRNNRSVALVRAVKVTLKPKTQQKEAA
jgi:hypothetical protein